jgi:hypothetical protein
MDTKFQSENLKGKDLLGDLDIDARKILNMTFKIQCVTCGLDSSGSGYGPVDWCCVNGNEPTGYIKIG